MRPSQMERAWTRYSPSIAHTLATEIATAEGLAPTLPDPGDHPNLRGLVAWALGSATAMAAFVWFFAINTIANLVYNDIQHEFPAGHVDHRVRDLRCTHTWRRRARHGSLSPQCRKHTRELSHSPPPRWPLLAVSEWLCALASED